jgi:hypothetical protein
MSELETWMVLWLCRVQPLFISTNWRLLWPCSTGIACAPPSTMHVSYWSNPNKKGPSALSLKN